MLISNCILFLRQWPQSNPTAHSGICIVRRKPLHCACSRLFVDSHVAAEVRLIRHPCQALAGLPEEKKIWKQAATKPQKRLRSGGAERGLWGWMCRTRPIWVPGRTGSCVIILLPRGSLRSDEPGPSGSPSVLDHILKQGIAVMAPDLFPSPRIHTRRSSFPDWFWAGMVANMVQVETWKGLVDWGFLTCFSWNSMTLTWISLE